MYARTTKNMGESIEGAALIAFHLLCPFLRPYRTQWGALNRELMAAYPGDDLVAKPKWQFTHAVTIHAPYYEVWKWLVQIGADRGGLYSYEVLENLAGCNIHNADRLIPEYQNLKSGDEIKIHPKAPGMKIKTVEPGHYILVHNDNRAEGNASYINMTWLWYLDQISPIRTRLISRSRTDYSPHFSNKLYMGPLLVEPIGFVMERKMLLGIQNRAERNWVLEPVWVG